MLQVSTYKEWYKGSVYLYDTVDTLIAETMLVFNFCFFAKWGLGEGKRKRVCFMLLFFTWMIKVRQNEFIEVLHEMVRQLWCTTFTIEKMSILTMPYISNKSTTYTMFLHAFKISRFMPHLMPKGLYLLMPSTKKFVFSEQVCAEWLTYFFVVSNV